MDAYAVAETQKLDGDNYTHTQKATDASNSCVDKKTEPMGKV